MEAAQIVAIAEHLSEMNKAFRGILPYGTEPTEESDAKWFGAGATDCCGPANMKNKERFAKVCACQPLVAAAPASQSFVYRAPAGGRGGRPEPRR